MVSPCPGQVEVSIAMSNPCWRPMRQSDLPAIVAISERAHPLFPEDPEVFAEKQRLFGPFCFTLDHAEEVAGYCFAHPWMSNRAPPLNRLIGSPPRSPDCLFVHDVALAPGARGKGASGALIEILEGVAARHKLPAITLVSLYGSDRVWSRCGFAPADISAVEIKAYGPSALYMRKSLR
jgi:GNAT superfamily N-acetyltransferase